jgi:hypothetical protein
MRWEKSCFSCGNPTEIWTWPNPRSCDKEKVCIVVNFGKDCYLYTYCIRCTCAITEKRFHTPRSRCCATCGTSTESSGIFSMRPCELSNLCIMLSACSPKCCALAGKYLTFHYGAGSVCHGCTKPRVSYGKIVQKMKKCSGCHIAWYCTKSCQRNDWRHGGHRTQCSELRRLKREK